MNDLIEKIEDLKKNPVKKIIDERIHEFEQLGKKNQDEIFQELCFCILTANFDAKKAIEIQKEIGDGFLSLPEGELSRKLSEMGYRFPYKRAEYIVKARKYKNELEGKTRQWLVENIIGLGMKEASHFLRNIGYKDVSIIDFHIIDLLVRYNLIEKPKTKSTSKYKYLEIENILKDLAEKTNLNPGELDLYLWYEETGKVLK